LDSARALIAQMRNVRLAQPGVWLQIGIKTSGRLIGDIAVRVDGDQARQATVGFTLAADAQGHGYATEALRTVISLLFTEHDVHRICADCDTLVHLGHARAVTTSSFYERYGYAHT
jgi:aminoglycoside 6'-N-acetyltransferase